MKTLCFLLILTHNFIGSFNQQDFGPPDDSYVPKFLQNRYGPALAAPPPSGVKTSHTKTGVKTAPKHYVSPYGSSYSTTTSKYRGGCDLAPSAPSNAELRCSTFSGCRATCLPNYQFSNGQAVLYINCQDGRWDVVGSNLDQMTSCQPVCLPPCENNGICVAPNQCNCPQNFAGPQCQFENKPCLNYPPMPLNAKRLCKPKSCNVMCLPGHEFPDGSQITSMLCKDGNWVPARENWVSIPDCRPTCDPPCQNGGNCLSFNVCQCPQAFRGPQCQYSIDSCSSRNLGFNGGHNCTGNADTLTCSISCPQGVQFEFPPAPIYVCSYETGIFIPLVVPQCVYAPRTEIIPVHASSHTYLTNHPDSLYTSTGRTIYGPPTQHVFPKSNDTNFVEVDPFGESREKLVTVEEKRPEPGSCFTWSGTHYKTFDGKVFSFDSKCAHTLVRDAVDNTFSIAVQNSPECSNGHPLLCHRRTKLYFQGKEFVLKRSENGLPIFATGKKVLPVPGRLPGLRAEMSAHHVVITLDSVGAKLKWDGQQLVQVEVKESLWNRTSGLCGNIDGDSRNDLKAKDGTTPRSITTLASSWQVDTLGDECNAAPTETHACRNEAGVKEGKTERAAGFCAKLLADKRFEACRSVMDTSVLLDACQWDYCSCHSSSDPGQCACDTLNVYVRECKHKGVQTLSEWRNEKTCPVKCDGGRVYMTCAPKGGQEVCGVSVESAEDEDACEEGCYCPKGTVLHDSTCITRDECPCRLRGKDFPPGSNVDKDCNTCTCSQGQWICTQVSCGARCSAIGDPHYLTFDGKHYDFMGQCSYYLVKADNFSIEAENVACAGAISLAMNFPITVSTGLPSCTKTITIKTSGHTFRLKQNHEVSVDEKDLTKLPYQVAGVSVRSVSSIFVIVELPNGVEVWWDGLTRVYVNAPAALKGKTKGLCGTFDDNQKDDFLTPEGDVEKSAVAFANKWKTEEKCNDVPDMLKSHPCDVNVQNRATAEEHCKKIKSNLFGDCHWHVDPEPFYQDCLYDMCSCEVKMANCLCPMIAAYAHECALKKIRIDWRDDIKECGVHCPGGQKYQVCGNSCARTCYDVATRPDCKETCVEGCACPEGETLDEHGECIPLGQCACQHDGLEFPAGYKEVRPASKGQELCTCINALWNCRLALPREIIAHPQASDLKSKCDGSKHFVFTTCENPEPVTCKNMHSQDMISAGVCHSGCECKEGYVLDTSSKTCVRPSECPCHHGGRSYGEKSVVQSDCNTCTCDNGKWNCTDRQCSAECGAWGDSHFKTFDGKMYDYQGQCDYMLAKGMLGSEDTFDISIQNVPCGSLGVSCSKSVTIKVGSGAQQEHVTLTRHKRVPDMQIFKRFTLRKQDLFMIVEAADIGLIVLWDKGTRVYVKVDPRWKNKLKGLCGNYNDNEMDDFQTPSGGVTEVSPQLFGDSWKLQSYCPEALEITDTCEQRPDRRVWAVKQCGILKTSQFALCHSEVPVDTYYDKCVFDSCACDQGGDCECLCTAISAYVHECNGKGVPIKWRSQELCPIQCDERCARYSPCVSTCPLETCDNLLVQNPLSKLCKEDACVEGCEPKPCSPGFVYRNSSFTDCVPRNVCKPVCMEVDDITYYEGDLLKEDECHSCFCSRGKETCTGQPCPTTTTSAALAELKQRTTTKAPTVTTTKPKGGAWGILGPSGVYMDRNKCKSGWTDWINQDKAPPTTKTKGKVKSDDVEPLPDTLVMNRAKGKNRCTLKDIVDVECRTVMDHVPSKATGLDVECSLERGLVCKSGARSCVDFEIRVLCDCGEETTTGEYLTEATTISAEYVPCDVSRPNQEHPSDCHLFYHCVPRAEGPEQVEKTCGLDMMYNPGTQVCDWPANVIALRPECGLKEEATTTKEEGEETITAEEEEILPTPGEICPPGKKYDECALQCDRLCQNYAQAVREEGFCTANYSRCEAGCVPETKRPCPDGAFAINEDSCVSKHDCICLSDDGKPVKPATVHKEGCRVCQCIDNFYSCDESACGTTKPEIPKKEKPIEEKGGEEEVVFFSTVTPPEECHPDRFVNLVQGQQPLPDEAFTASSVLGSDFEPKYARLNTKGGSWKPEKSDKDQYLQINLGKQEPVYGVIVQGSPSYREYVTSYKVATSPDKSGSFAFVPDENNRPQVFRGSFDAHIPVKQLFLVPVEAQRVRIHPVTWHEEISLRLELIGCEEEQTTVVTTPLEEFTSTEVLTSTTVEEVQVKAKKKRKKAKSGETSCSEPMGLDNGLMSDQQVSVSSELLPTFKKQHLKLSESEAWQPLLNTPTEWIEFDFLEPRNVTGIETKGGPNGWVTAYNVKYSNNGKDWSPILDEDLQETVFPGNYDHDTSHTNTFDLPILTRHVKILPTKWEETIQMKVEPLGCFKPYPPMEREATEAPSPCNGCPGTDSGQLEMDACRCSPDLWWDGENCVARTQCPCMVGHMAYSVGTVFEKEDCSDCVCKLGGVAHCTPKLCEKCDKGLRSVVTSTCGCLCLPCEDGTIVCPTSNVCLNATKWCDGVEDCPDDEIGCPTTPSPTTILPPTEAPFVETVSKQVTCSKPTCPDGYKSVTKTGTKKYTMFTTPGTKTKSRKSYLGMKTAGTKWGLKGGRKTSLKKPAKMEPEGIDEKKKQKECPEFECVTTRPPPPPFITGKPQPVCPPHQCPPHYRVEFAFEITNEACPRYECIPPPPPDAVCNVTGRTFTTFDDTEYKYDICNHVLARDLENDEWDIALKKSCDKTCTRNLVIHHQDHTFVLYPNLTVEYDGYKYTTTQTKKIGSQSQFFTITRLGDTLLFVSNRYGFWVIWDKQDNAKVGVSTKLVGKVDGLCGFFNENPKDDKRKPEGKPARTTAEFGDSWAQVEQLLECEARACPIQVQNKAWEMCNKVKDETLAPCTKAVDLNAFVSRCLETTCACLQASNGNLTAEEECRCQTLQAFVANCLQSNTTLELTDWRIQHDCPVACEAPLIHHDCYRRPCELTCETISNPNACPKLGNVCFPGCYCPPGLVRKGETCVKPSTCRDCECNVLPHLQYVTYDEANFTVNGNCVYVMSRDQLENEKEDHKFQVLITNAPCKDSENKMCVGKVTILYEGHKIHIYRDDFRNKLKVIVDAERVEDFDEIRNWADVTQTRTKHLKMLLKQVQVEVSVYYPSLGVSVKAPSHKYGGKLEGLCGDCNRNPDDDIKTPKGERTGNIDDFGLSWLYDKLPGQTKEACAPVPEETCPTLPPESDPCLQLLDTSRFGQCHLLLDPTMFVEWCNRDTCGGKPQQACQSIGTYANQCLHSNICVNWHSNLCPAEICPPEKIYKQCGTNCPKTCDSIKEKHESKCEELPVDGCFCQEGKVLLNNTCVEERECEVCDEEGHHPGDTWQKDVCTACSCLGSSLKCETKHCPSVDTVCEEGFSAVKIPSGEKECCDKYICVPEATPGPTCEAPQQLQCSSGQTMKLITSADGCQKFICECKPIEECEAVDINTDSPLEDGVEKVVNYDDCCPTVKKVCRPELCPDAPHCPAYHTVKKTDITERCCPIYDCEPPKKCIVSLNYTAGELGGERPRNEFERQKLLKEVDETWSDGPCRECECVGNPNDGYRSTCSVKNCPSLKDSGDAQDFVLETEPVANQCCPEIKRVACKQDGKIYKVGEKWPVEGDYCSVMECAETSAGLQKLTEKKSCDDKCNPGYEYVPATPQSKECCGKCKCVACVVEGVKRKIGEEWESADFCSKYVCLNINGSSQVQETVVSCADVAPELQAQFVYETYPVEGQCCKKHKPVACKVGEAVYKVNETWPSPDSDRCKNVTCVENSIGELVKQESVKTCNKECKKGWEYKESEMNCCGECVPTACVVDEEIKTLGETWTSSDNCTTYSCAQIDDQFFVLSQQESCPSTKDCKPENIYLKGCCMHCNITMESQKTCAAEEIKSEKTIRLVNVTRPFNGYCTNEVPLKGFVECVGNCESSTMFNPKTATFESACTCCRGIKHKTLITELVCEDGTKYLKQIAVPIACSCEGCVPAQVSANIVRAPTKTFTKTGVKSGVKTGVKTALRTPEAV